MTPSHSALLGKLQHADWKTINEVLEEALNSDCPRDAICKIVEKRLVSKVYIINKLLARLVVETQSSSLYEKVQHQLTSDIWSLITLYEGKYPDPSIEEKLCTELYKIALNDAEPARGYVVDAMREVGSPDVLPTLEALASELAPSAKVLEVFSDQLDLLGALRADARIKFMIRLTQAIDRIRLRQRDADDPVSQTLPSGLTENEQDLLIVYRIKAETYLNSDPEVSMTFIRKGAEALGKRWYRAATADKKGKPAEKMMLDELIQFLNGAEVPQIVSLFLRTVQPFANYGSHDQDGDQTALLTKEIVAPFLSLYGEAVAYHLQAAASDLRFSSSV